MTNDIIKEFKIGYAPDSWDGVLNFLKYKKSPLDIAEKVGLIIKKQPTSTSPQSQVPSPHYYDRFRNRLMFPILDVQGRIIGFGARTLGNDDAKYINSPESEIFKKGEVFYGIHQAKASASKQGFALVVEGYFDLIALHQFGFKNSVATMGTALTENHLRKLRNYSSEVYALFDGDDAGRRAALRSIPFFLDEGAKAKIVLIPKGMDPDDLLRKHGNAPMGKCINDAQPFMDFLLDETKKKFDTTSSRGKITFIEEVGAYISKMKSDVERNFYIEKTAHLIQVGRDVVASAIKEGSRVKGQGSRVMPSNREIISAKTSGVKLAEETIVKILMVYPNLYNENISDVINVFRENALKEIGMLLVKSLNAKNGMLEIADLINKVSDENIKKWLIKTSMSDNEEIKEHPEKILEDCCRTVITNNVDKEEAKALLKRYQEADKSGDRDMFETAAAQFLEKKKKLS
ncbi:MAG: toprim domain-containing protein [Deltaproteobacteria bacterium]|nr:toprim domain-containing protein [Deltaproteobacteria bacterium]